MDLLKPFDMIYREEEIHVVPRKVGKDTVYILHFPDRRPILMLTQATDQHGKAFWTTVPEQKDRVRQEAALREAERLGALVVAHYESLNKERET